MSPDHDFNAIALTGLIGGGTPLQYYDTSRTMNGRMNAIWLSTASDFGNRRLLWIAALILAVDIAFVGLFVLWAIAAHYELRDIWIFGRNEFSMAEGQLTEQWGFAKLALASVLLLIIAGFQRQVFFWGLTALLAIMLLSDSMQLHEKINAALYPLLATVLDRLHIDVLTKSALAAAPLLAMALGLWSTPVRDRRPMLRLAAPAIALGFWASIIDLSHGLYEKYFDGGRTIGNLVEEGGEGFLITAVLMSALFYFWQAFFCRDRAIEPIDA